MKMDGSSDTSALSSKQSVCEDLLYEIDVKPDVTTLNKDERDSDIAILSDHSLNHCVQFEKIKTEETDQAIKPLRGDTETGEFQAGDENSQQDFGKVLTDDEDESDSISSIDEEDCPSDDEWSPSSDEYKDQVSLSDRRKKAQSPGKPVAPELIHETKPKERRKSEKVDPNFKRFVCPYCERRFKQRQELRRHQLNRHAPPELRPFKCTFCKYATSRVSDLQRHLRRMHEKEQIARGEVVPAKKRVQLPEKTHLCDICGYRARWAAHLARHKAMHSTEKSYGCTYPGCDRRYKLEDHLKRHEKQHLVEEEDLHRRAGMPKDEEIKIYECSEADCNFKTAILTSFKQHATTHSEERPFECEFPGCNFRAKWKTSLSQHLIRHYPERGHACPFPGCSHVAWSAGALRLHEQIHNSERNFACDVPGCEYRTHAEINLAQHKRNTHKVGLKFRCSKCSKMFVSGRYRDAHVKLCPTEPKNSTKSNSSARSKTIGRSKPASRKGSFECFECGKICSTEYHLQTHMKTHSEKQQPRAKPIHKCKECDKVCSTAFNLKTHMGTHQRKSINNQTRQKYKKKLVQGTTEDSGGPSDIKTEPVDVIVNLEEDCSAFKSEFELEDTYLSKQTDLEVVQATVGDACALLRNILGGN